MNAYIIPIHNWPDTENTRWYLADELGEVLPLGSIHSVSFATLTDARDYAKKKGWNLPDEP